MAAALALTPGSLGVYSYGLLKATRIPLKVLALDGKRPSVEALADGSWRVTRPLGFVVRPERLARVKPLLDLTAMEEGWRILRDAVSDLSMRKAAANAVRAILLTVGLLLALSVAGVDLTALSVLGGALGVGLGLGLQKLASNYVSGFVILLERSLRIGDTVRIDNFEGRITDISTGLEI